MLPNHFLIRSLFPLSGFVLGGYIFLRRSIQGVHGITKHLTQGKLLSQTSEAGPQVHQGVFQTALGGQEKEREKWCMEGGNDSEERILGNRNG